MNGKQILGILLMIIGVMIGGNVYFANLMLQPVAENVEELLLSTQNTAEKTKEALRALKTTVHSTQNTLKGFGDDLTQTFNDCSNTRFYQVVDKKVCEHLKTNYQNINETIDAATTAAGMLHDTFGEAESTVRMFSGTAAVLSATIQKHKGNFQQQAFLVYGLAFLLVVIGAFLTRLATTLQDDQSVPSEN